MGRMMVKEHALRRWRMAEGLSQAAVGKLIGVNTLTVARWEWGATEPQKRHWDRIVRITGMTRAQFLGFAASSHDPPIADSPQRRPAYAAADNPAATGWAGQPIKSRIKRNG